MPAAADERDDRELIPGPVGARIYEESHRVGPADVTPAGRMRLDEIARWLQDLAYADIVDAGLSDVGFWIVRRCRIRVERFPRFPAELRLRTFCSGVSPLAAERRTSIDGDGARVETVAVWVNLDPSTRLPARLPERFRAAYGPIAAERRARGRLRHPPPPAGARNGPWSFRAADLDVAGHVNNATYWEIVEERLEPGFDGILDAEIEYRAAALGGTATVIESGDRLWVADAAGETHASALVVADPAG
jgi:acyl-ACP thioesterase